MAGARLRLTVTVEGGIVVATSLPHATPSSMGGINLGSQSNWYLLSRLSREGRGGRSRAWRFPGRSPRRGILKPVLGSGIYQAGRAVNLLLAVLAPFS